MDSTDINNKTSESNNGLDRNKIIIALAVLVILILGVIGYFVFSKMNTPEYKLDKADALLKDGKTDEALKAYQEIITQYSNTRWEYLSNLRMGGIYFDKRDYDSAISYLKRAIELNPDKDCSSNNKLGRIYFELGYTDVALWYFSNVIEINRNFKEECSVELMKNANINIGRIYLKEGNYTKAIKHFRAAHESSPDAYTNYFLGEAYYLDGDYDKAETLLNKYLESKPTNEVGVETAQKYLKAIQENKKPA